MVQHAVILAGGSGTRLWPASRRSFPKQFLDFGNGQSLFIMTVVRALSLGIRGTLLIVTHKDHLGQIEKQCRQAASVVPGPKRILIIPEPEAKNTAPAVAFACAVLKSMGEGKSSILVLPADHTIEPLEVFKADVEKASRLAEQGYLVTFGIPPERPETGYGYIEAGTAVITETEAREGGGEALADGLPVKKFKEKPDLKTAERFLRLGNHFWNSGMFAYRVDTFFSELAEYAPKVARPFLESRLRFEKSAPGAIDVLGDPEAAARIYSLLPSISLDYALMEKSARCAMVKAAFTWSDVGSWDEVTRLFGARAGKVISVSSQRNFVYADLPVALAGVDDLLVVVKNGAVLIARRGSSQLVKDVVRELQDRGLEELL